MLNIFVVLTQASLAECRQTHRRAMNQSLFGHNAPAGDMNMNAAALANIGFNLAQENSNIFTYSKTLSYSFGKQLFEEMVKKLDAVYGADAERCAERRSGSTDCEKSNFYFVQNIMLEATQHGECNTDDLKDLYFYFEQMRSLISPEAYAEYVNAVENRAFDTAFSILAIEFGSLCEEQKAYIRALKQKKKMVKQGRSGILLLDVYNGITYHINAKFNKGSIKKQRNILLIPNGALNIYVFYAYSLYLIDMMVKDSIYYADILALKKKVLAPSTSTSLVNKGESYGTRILLYKFLVYHYLSLEISHVEYPKGKAIMKIIMDKMFANGSLKDPVIDLFTNYVNTVLFAMNK